MDQNGQMFTVIGEPQGKGRPRFYRQGNLTRTMTPQKTVLYENLIQLEYERQCNGFRFDDNAMLAITVEAIYGIPKSASKKNKELMLKRLLRPTKKPDGDNILKAVCDGLNEVAYHDDKQLVDCRVVKFYGELPQIKVYIREV